MHNLYTLLILKLYSISFIYIYIFFLKTHYEAVKHNSKTLQQQSYFGDVRRHIWNPARTRTSNFTSTQAVILQPSIRCEVWWWAWRWKTPSQNGVNSKTRSCVNTNHVLLFCSFSPFIRASCFGFFLHKWETNIWMCLYFPPFICWCCPKASIVFYFKIALVQTCQILKSFGGQNTNGRWRRRRRSAHVLPFLTPWTRHGAYIGYFFLDAVHV